MFSMRRALSLGWIMTVGSSARIYGLSSSSAASTSVLGKNIDGTGGAQGTECFEAFGRLCVSRRNGGGDGRVVGDWSGHCFDLGLDGDEGDSMCAQRGGGRGSTIEFAHMVSTKCPSATL